MTSDEQIFARYDWHKSQAKWFKARKSAWGYRQAAWHKRQANSIPGLVSAIIARTIRRHAPAIVQNIQSNNALLSRLKERRA